MPQRLITLLTDFGLTDQYVAAMKGVILGICPDAHLIDICHEIPAWNIGHAAWTLTQAWPYFPTGTIHLVVVDPGVGSNRRPLVAGSGGHVFVAPDNGVLASGLNMNLDWVRQITAAQYFRPAVSHTFHGRDIFAPVAAHLAAGINPEDLGPLVTDYVRLESGNPVHTGPKQIAGIILHIDRFGNLITNFSSDSFPQLATGPFKLQVGSETVTSWCRSYAEAVPDTLFLINGSSGYLEISINQKSAADAVGLGAQKTEAQKKGQAFPPVLLELS